MAELLEARERKPSHAFDLRSRRVHFSARTRACSRCPRRAGSSRAEGRPNGRFGPEARSAEGVFREDARKRCGRTRRRRAGRFGKRARLKSASIMERHPRLGEVGRSREIADALRVRDQGGIVVDRAAPSCVSRRGVACCSSRHRGSDRAAASAGRPQGGAHEGRGRFARITGRSTRTRRAYVRLVWPGSFGGTGARSDGRGFGSSARKARIAVASCRAASTAESRAAIAKGTWAVGSSGVEAGSRGRPPRLEGRLANERSNGVRHAEKTETTPPARSPRRRGVSSWGRPSECSPRLSVAMPDERGHFGPYGGG